MLFKISQDIFLFETISGGNDQVDMISHNTPAVQQESFVFLAITEAINQYIFVYVSGEYIYPFYHSKRYKVKPGLIAYFVFYTYGLGVSLFCRVTDSRIHF